MSSDAPEHFRRLERIYAKARINEYYDPTLRVTDGAAELTIPLSPKMHHAADAVHGSVYFKALDDAAFFAANSLVPDVFVLTASFNLYLLRPVTTGSIHARGRVIQQTRRLILAESELDDDQGRRIAHGNGTFMPSSIQLDKMPGYHEDG